MSRKFTNLTLISFTVLLSGSLVLAAPANPTFPYYPGFNIQDVTQFSRDAPGASWEFGTEAEALLELYDPAISVFGDSPFGSLKDYMGGGNKRIEGLEYAKEKIIIQLEGTDVLGQGGGAIADPASLGVSAVLLGDYLQGKGGDKYAQAAKRQVEVLKASRTFDNGAFSHRKDKAQLWSDFVYMAPPFLAYYAVHEKDLDLLQTAVTQCGLYRDILRDPDGNNLWRHITDLDDGLWSTGNGWAAAGMARVLAAVMKAPDSLTGDWKNEAVGDLTHWIQEILDGAIESDPDKNGLLRNYLDGKDGNGFGEISGSSLLAAVAYRMVVLKPDFGSKYIKFADGIRGVLGQGDTFVKEDGKVVPAVNPQAWWSTKKYMDGSPEGQSFVVLMYAAWRDCVAAEVCSVDSLKDSGAGGD